MKNIKRIRASLTAMLAVFAMAFVFIAPAHSATYKDTTIGQGKYYHYTAADGEYFSISSNTKVTQSITFTRNAPSTVKAGYFKSASGAKNYQNKLSGSNKKTMSKSYTISNKGKYKFFIYNGSDSSIRCSKMTISF